MRRHSYAAYLLLLLGVACTTKRTEVFLGVMTNLSACDGIKAVQLNVFGGPMLDFPAFNKTWDLTGFNCPAGEINLPGSFGVHADESRRVRLVLRGISNTGQEIVRESLIGLVKEKTLFVRLALVDECKNVNCGAGRTCVEGVCRPVPSSLGSAGGMPLTLAPSPDIAAQTAFSEERVLPEYVAGMENRLECNSGAAIKPYRFSNPNPPPGAPANWDPNIPAVGTCPPDSFCEEGTCYKYPTSTSPSNGDGGVGWQLLTLNPSSPDAGAAPGTGAYPEGNQAVQAGNQVIVWGGRDSTGTALRDTRKFVPSPTQPMLSVLVGDIGPSGMPLPELGATTFDGDRGKLVTYRIDNSSGLTGFIVELDTAMNMWAVASTRVQPPPREHARIAYDPVRKQTILFGGSCQDCCNDPAACCSSTALCDTWAWGTNGQGMPGWTALTPATKPTGRKDGALVFHEAIGKIVLFGGSRGPADPPCDAARPNDLYCNDTWLWDGTNWARANAPFMGNLVDGVLLYDAPHRQALWMNYPSNSPANTPSEVFGFDGNAWALRVSYASAPPLGAFSAIYDGPSNAVYVLGGTDDAGAVSGLWRVPLP